MPRKSTTIRKKNALTRFLAALLAGFLALLNDMITRVRTLDYPWHNDVPHEKKKKQKKKRNTTSVASIEDATSLQEPDEKTHTGVSNSVQSIEIALSKATKTRKKKNKKAVLGAIDSSSSEALPPATGLRDSEILLNLEQDCTEIDSAGSRSPVAELRASDFQEKTFSNASTEALSPTENASILSIDATTSLTQNTWKLPLDPEVYPIAITTLASLDDAAGDDTTLFSMGSINSPTEDAPSLSSIGTTDFVDDHTSTSDATTQDFLSFNSMSTLTVSSTEIDHSQVASVLRLIEVPRRKPPCYTNNRNIQQLLDLASENFILSECEGSVFGSTNYKTVEFPHDFDIIIENVTSDHDRTKVDALLQRFKQQGGVVTVSDPQGMGGYRTEKRHVIPMIWKKWKIDFILSSKTIVEHSKGMDFTIGALYYNLRQKKMYRVSSLSTMTDLKHKRLTTVVDALVSFTEDPSRIFRAVRLMAIEGYRLSTACENAIHQLSAESNNIFTSMKVGKLFQQLDLLFNSGYPYENITIFYQLFLFSKLYNRIEELSHRGGYKYLMHLQPYCPQYDSSPQAPVVCFVPYLPCYFFTPNQTPSIQQDPHTQQAQATSSAANTFL